MKCPFPGIDPYLEHPVLWGSLHARLIVEIANQLQPQLDPRYISSIEKRVYLDIDNLEIHETRVEILDSYNELKLVALIEVVSPTNKAAGAGRVSYKAKQQETLARECHLIEIDLLSHGRHLLCIPEWRVRPFCPWISCGRGDLYESDVLATAQDPAAEHRRPRDRQRLSAIVRREFAPARESRLVADQGHS